MSKMETQTRKLSVTTSSGREIQECRQRGICWFCKQKAEWLLDIMITRSRWARTPLCKNCYENYGGTDGRPLQKRTKIKRSDVTRIKDTPNTCPKDADANMARKLKTCCMEKHSTNNTPVDAVKIEWKQCPKCNYYLYYSTEKNRWYCPIRHCVFGSREASIEETARILAEHLHGMRQASKHSWIVACTRPRGHSGNHHAHVSSGWCLAVWKTRGRSLK